MSVRPAKTGAVTSVVAVTVRLVVLPRPTPPLPLTPRSPGQTMSYLPASSAWSGVASSIESASS